MSKHLSSFPFALLISATVLMTGHARAAPNPCVTEPTEACVLDLAMAAFSSVEGDRQRINAALELSLALTASGDRQAATKLLRAAGRQVSAMSAATDVVEARLDLAHGFLSAGDKNAGASQLAAAESVLDNVEDAHKRVDLGAKIAVAYVEVGQSTKGLRYAKGLPESDETFAAYKARALHDIAPILAKNGDLSGALATIEAITMGITYYQSVCRSDVGYLASIDGSEDEAEELFEDAAAVARAQENGYFVAGALRQLADAEARLGRTASANANFQEAVVGARAAPSAQERARAISRIVTTMADNEMTANAAGLIAEALAIAATEGNAALRSWAHYEIAGAAAFAGLFDHAAEVLIEIPSDLEFAGVSLKSATQRDVAWGLARHRQTAGALELAATIVTARERTQAFSRIARAMADPAMRALPRYL